MPHSSKRIDGTISDGRSGERSTSSRNSNQNDDNSPSGRRDENLASLSFRHFLQPHSDVVPTTTTRHGRNVRGSASVDLVDGVSSMALPDFVQDHLVLESLVSSSSSNTGGGNNPSSSTSISSSNSGNHHHHLEQQHAQGAVGGSSSSNSSLDMSVLSAILPDFTTSQRNQNCLSKRNRRQENSTNNGDGACSLPSTSSSCKVALPDFLSDGPMLCSSDGLHHNNNNITSSSSSPNRSVGASASSLHNRVAENSSRDSELTAANMDRLRRDLAERNRRLSQLESDFNTARNETSMFETAYLTATANLDAANRQISKLKSELALLKDQFNNDKSTRRRDNSNAVDPSTSTHPTQRNVPIHYTNVDVTALSAMHHYLTESLKQLEQIYPPATGNGIALEESKLDKEKK